MIKNRTRTGLCCKNEKKINRVRGLRLSLVDNAVDLKRGRTSVFYANAGDGQFVVDVESGFCPLSFRRGNGKCFALNRYLVGTLPTVRGRLQKVTLSVRILLFFPPCYYAFIRVNRFVGLKSHLSGRRVIAAELSRTFAKIIRRVLYPVDETTP